MPTVTSFRASDVSREQLAGILADYLELDRARIFRRLFVKRFALLAVILGGASWMWLSEFAFWFIVGSCVAVPIWAWAIEHRIARRLSRRLDGVPLRTDEAGSTASRVDSVRKS